MSNFLDDIKGRLKDIPPWGYALIAGGVLVLAYFTTKKRAVPEEPSQTFYAVDPAAETYNNDSEWRMQDMYLNLENKLNEKDETLEGAIQGIKEEIAALKTPAAVTPVAPAPVVPVAPVTPVAPAPVAPAAPSKPSWFSSLSRKSYGTPSGGWNSGSVVDFLKSKGYNADYAERAKIAAGMGISNYSGSVAQNIQMLNNLKAAGI